MDESSAAMEITTSHEARVGELTVRRALPRRGRRMVGAWCFADHMGPVSVTAEQGVGVGPHPHMGLQTVTWLIEGTQLHRDSLGSEQVLTAGELNLMTAGYGVAHAEEATDASVGRLQGIQLWVAQPEETRNGSPAFSHHADLPRVDLKGGTATILIGAHQGASSPAEVATPLLGMELNLRSTTILPLDPAFEHGLIVLEGALRIGGAVLAPGHLGYCGRGTEELLLEVDQPTVAMVLGGAPFDEPIEMWWNFVGRSRSEFVEAYRSWADGDGRFGDVASQLDRILTTPPMETSP